MHFHLYIHDFHVLIGSDCSNEFAYFDFEQYTTIRTKWTHGLAICLAIQRWIKIELRTDQIWQIDDRWLVCLLLVVQSPSMQRYTYLKWYPSNQTLHSISFTCECAKNKVSYEAYRHHTCAVIRSHRMHTPFGVLSIFYFQFVSGGNANTTRIYQRFFANIIVSKLLDIHLPWKAFFFSSSLLLVVCAFAPLPSPHTKFMNFMLANSYNSSPQCKILNAQNRNFAIIRIYWHFKATRMR